MIHFSVKKIWIIGLLLGLIFSVLNLRPVGARALPASFPRKANYFLQWSLSDTQAKQLAKWDVVILDMENQIKNPALLKKMRELNPDIVILAYITSQEILSNSTNSQSWLRRKLGQGIKDNWYVRNGSDAIINYWSNTHLLNVAANCPLSGGQKWNDYLSKFVADEIKPSGLWDGVFFDNSWGALSWFTTDVDLNLDGQKDTDFDAQWVAGMKELFVKTRGKTGADFLLVGNGAFTNYKNESDGIMIEGFQNRNWAEMMNVYLINDNRADKVNIINSNADNQNKPNDYQTMRFGLTSALLGNGFYSFDYGNQDHGQLWWYDEYEADLGKPTGKAISQNGLAVYKTDVWQRDFEHGAVVVNSTNNAQTVDLGGDYEKLRGKQDTSVNDGSIVSELDIAAKDGQLLLKTFATVNDVVFRNGDFVRFLRPDGSRARNGFFVFELGYEGGVQLAHIDLDGNGARDLLVASHGKLEAWRDDGLLLLRVFPYTANFTGDLKVAVGDFDNDGRRMEVAVAPSNGSAQPIKIYHYDGSAMVENLLPLGKKYKGGLSVALGQDSTGAGRLVVGSGQGKEPKIFIYDIQMKLKKTWLAFERAFLGGINVATGNVDGKPGDEVIVGAGKGKAPIIKVFDFNGKQLYKDFRAYTTVSKSGIEVLVADVDFDGMAEVIAQGGAF